MKYIFSPVFLARLFFVLLSTCIAALVAFKKDANPPLFSAIAFVGATLFVLVEHATNAIASRKFLLAMFGWLIGLIFARLVYPTIPARLIDSETALLICNLMFSYLGIVIAIKHSDWLRARNLRFLLVNPQETPKVLDSSVIIDGRIVDVVRLGLLSGPVLLPNFVLMEIQSIADSGDPSRRAKGRRGLDVLDRLRMVCKTLEVNDTDYPETPDVDQKLLQLCVSTGADLVTNDYNLHKIAQLRRIEVINLNELSDALKPTVYVGETLDLLIARQGKEAGQGIGYLKDGTMVVVENTDHLIGQTLEVVISNILQNPSGRLVFARLREEEREKLRA